MAAKKKTKAITDSVASAGVGPAAAEATSSVAAMSFEKALSPKQAYEVNSTYRRVVNAIADNEAKAKARIFSRSTGEEILSGDLYNLCRKPNKYHSMTSFHADMIRWKKITGETAILPLVDGRYISSSKSINSLKLLDPTRLRHMPDGARSLEFVSQWQYTEASMTVPGLQAMFTIPSSDLVFAKNFNPNSQVRGSSEAISLINEISTNYYVQRYNIQRFKNGVKGDIVIKFPIGTKPKVAKEFAQLWQEEHSIYRDNGFTISTIIGTETEIEELGLSSKDGEYLNLHNMNAETIAGLHGVPASVMGFYSKTRFDTIDAEIEAFAENVLLPDLIQDSDLFQHQIVDRYFAHSSSGTKKNKVSHMSKQFKSLYERAMDEYGESDVVFIFDPDTLPILAKLNRSKIAQAKEIREALDLSATEAAEYVGLDIPHNELRDEIWVDSKRINISEPKANQDEAVKVLNNKIISLEAELVEPKPLTVDEKHQLEALKTYYREFRASVLASFEKNETISKVEWTNRAKQFGQKFLVQLSKDYLAIRSIQKSEGTIEQVKSYLNSISKPSVLKQYIGENK